MDNPYEVSRLGGHTRHDKTTFQAVIWLLSILGGLGIVYVEGFSLVADRDFNVLVRISILILLFVLTYATFDRTLGIASIFAFSFLTFQYLQRLVIITLIAHVGAERSIDLNSLFFVTYFGICLVVSLFGLLPKKSRETAL